MLTPSAFTATVFLSAFLLFLVQPLFARLVLPLLGGAPAVWTSCVLFFQLALLVGYGYSHLLTQRLRPRLQVLSHLGFMLTPFFFLPIGVATSSAPSLDSHPTIAVLMLLLRSVGLPFLVVSTTAPLLQRWFSYGEDDGARDPYYLYAASNAGSLLALLLYPLLIERRFTLRAQGWIWTGGYGALVLGVFGCALSLFPRLQRVAAPTTSEHSAATEAAPLSFWQRARWVALAAVPSSISLGATTYITTDVASVPLLWVLPLGVYLLSFVIVFARRPILPHRLVNRVLPIAVMLIVMLLLRRPIRPITLIVGAHVLFVLVAALYTHGALAASRPKPLHLTEFYLWMAVGGALGGCFNAIVAPIVFKGTFEYPIAIVLLCLLWRAEQGRAFRLRELLYGAALGVLYVGLRETMSHYEFLNIPWRRAIGAMTGLTLLIYLRRPLSFAVGVGALLVGYAYWIDLGEIIPFKGRSFFGTYRVYAEDDLLKLYHGTTLHGIQSLEADRRSEPLSYYYRGGPIGNLIQTLPHRPQRIAVIGLGAGGLSTYVDRGEQMTFYEIDPMVRKIALGAGRFTYLTDAMARGADIQIVIGDARMTLQRAVDPKYDLIVLDAFSSDAIPIHLLTREAIQLYISKLSPTGVLALHITNRHLDLLPVVTRLAQDAGLVGRSRDDTERTHELEAAGLDLEEQCVSNWVALARTEADLGASAHAPHWLPLPQKGGRLWTDDYADLLSTLY